MRRSLAVPGQLAYEVALAGNVVKGYGETSERGHRNLRTILALAAEIGQKDAGQVTSQVRAERLRALSEGETPSPTVTTGEPVFKPISFMPRNSASTRSD